MAKLLRIGVKNIRDAAGTKFALSLVASLLSQSCVLAL